MLGTALDRPDVGATLEALRSASPFAALRLDPAEARATALEAVLDGWAGDGTETVYVGNPLRSALTIERFLLQVIGPEVDLRIDRSPADLAKLLGQPGEGWAQRLIVVQQPESIDPETRDLLAATGAHLSSLPTRFLFVGSLAFRPIRPMSLDPVPEQAEILPAPPIALVRPPSPPPTATPTRSYTRLPDAIRHWTDALPIVFLLGCIGAALTVGLAGRTPAAAQALPPVRFLFDPSSPTYRVTTAVSNAKLLRQRFDEFLTEREADLPPLSAAQKDALFNEFLARPPTP